MRKDHLCIDHAVRTKVPVLENGAVSIAVIDTCSRCETVVRQYKKPIEGARYCEASTGVVNNAFFGFGSTLGTIKPEDGNE